MSKVDWMQQSDGRHICFIKMLSVKVFCSVADPEPDPHVFGPPGSGSGSTSQRYGSGSCSGSGSGSFRHRAKIVRKTLIPTLYVTLFDFLSLKNDVNVASKINKQKKLF
jgi:hypothetical protein